MGSRAVIDPDKMDRSQVESALKRLPPGYSLTFLGSAITVEALASASRRFALRMPPKVTWKTKVDVDALRSPTTATDELLRVHAATVEQLTAERGQ